MSVGWLILIASLKGFRTRNEVNLWVCLGGCFQGGQAESEDSAWMEKPHPPAQGGAVDQGEGQWGKSKKHSLNETEATSGKNNNKTFSNQLVKAERAWTRAHNG